MFCLKFGCFSFIVRFLAPNFIFEQVGLISFEQISLCFINFNYLEQCKYWMGNWMILMDVAMMIFFHFVIIGLLTCRFNICRWKPLWSPWLPKQLPSLRRNCPWRWVSFNFFFQWFFSGPIKCFDVNGYRVESSQHAIRRWDN